MSALAFGFREDSAGVHDSRTIMLAELRALLAACSASASLAEYRSAVVEENVLAKRTVATRQNTFRRLRQLYALDSAVPLFRALRDLWDADPDAQPLLALLCAVARDPVLRATAPFVLDQKVGTPVSSAHLAEAVEHAFPGRYNERLTALVGRNLASSWQQSGHLVGRQGKTRTTARCHPANVTYALLLGHFTDARGAALFGTLWCRLLDAPLRRLEDMAVAASRQGWLEYRHGGAVTDITFRHLLGNMA